MVSYNKEKAVENHLWRSCTPAALVSEEAKRSVEKCIRVYAPF